MHDPLAAFDRPIAFNRSFVSIEYAPGKRCGVAAAVLLSQAVYWQRRAAARSVPAKLQGSGWWWKTQEAWEEETGLTPREQRTAVSRLVKAGALEAVLAGNPAKLWYRVDAETLEVRIGEIQKCAGRTSRSDEGAEQEVREAHSTLDETTGRRLPRRVAVGDHGSSPPSVVEGPWDPHPPPKDEEQRRREALARELEMERWA